MLSLILIVPGSIAFYALVVRGLLHKIPALQKFYAEADGFWAKVWALCGNSFTILWSYVLGGIGTALGLVDQLGPMIGDPNLNIKDQLIEALKNHPSAVTWVPVIISMITIASRVRKGLT